MSSDYQFKLKIIANSFILYDDDFITDPSLQLFDAAPSGGDYHTNKGAQQNKNAASSASGSSASGIGRAEVTYLHSGGNDLVLKHYYRGGLVARLVKDRYLGRDVVKSRAFREFRLLKMMRAMGLPVPDAVAARVERSLISYRADLITKEIKNVRTLADVLAAGPIDEVLWKKVGHTIKKFHVQDIYHADLNARNILIDADNVIYLIDFDNSYVRVGAGRWKTGNLSRLHRSLSKFKASKEGFHFSEDDWQALLDGYSLNGDLKD